MSRRPEPPTHLTICCRAPVYTLRLHFKGHTLYPTRWSANPPGVYARNEFLQQCTRCGKRWTQPFREVRGDDGELLGFE